MRYVSFRNVNADTRTLWRYMSFAKFVALLDAESLFFCPIRKFTDEYEGFIHQTFFNEFHNLMYPVHDQGEQKTLWTVEHAWIHILDNCFVSCWCIAEDELKSMWDAYAGTCPGVAIRTRCDVLVDYLKKQYAGQLLSEPVRYIDHEYTPVPLLHPLKNEKDLFLYFLQKDNLPKILQHMRDFSFVFEKVRQFEFESEFRLVALGNHGIDFDRWESMAKSGIGVEYGTLAVLNSFYIESEDQIARIRSMKSSKGLDVHFRIDKVADKLLVSPGSPSWFSSLVGNMLRRFGISDLCVENSSLADTI